MSSKSSIRDFTEEDEDGSIVHLYQSGEAQILTVNNLDREAHSIVSSSLRFQPRRESPASVSAIHTFATLISG